MCPKKICLPAYEWYGDTYVKHEFPDAWTLNVQHMAGYNTKLLSKIEMMEKLQHPIGSQPLRDLARGKRKCVIIFDDMTRPTKVWQMLPVVFDELNKGGLTDDKIVFVKATGAHGARMLPDFVKKLGEDVAERFLVFNHNP
ncbi:MAG: DUF2088 domain-containing protein, partial [Candidatus Bathyarchaeota archaeon]